MQDHIKIVNKERGWDKTTIPELFMYLSEEVGELAKASRQEMKLFDDKKSDRFDISGELADVLSYVLDIANRFGVDLEEAYWKKAKKNKGRTWVNG